MKLTGLFQVHDWQESVITLLNEDTKLSNATVLQTYEGDLKGTSTVYYQLYYDRKGNAVFNGLEVFQHADNDENTLVIRHKGQFENGIASSTFTIIDCEYNPEMIGKTGSFESIEGQKSAYSIE
ncbi:DUF3224 domain-containing protein [Pseudoalteromonas luteoviolacea]|uniref:DUF3224 domain-containing protein n=1 Tax=Pseudoalteromonas luteoviolacea S4054 TaxID=1129367 RepID=A0A0F6AC14_9GAMM|nr:DUF3224 domain-containing protein [Pseudoalteromonas luteoviolacea]AOT10627.1 hypothetical protein S4054249_22465 [Pseudoalteromonas luteoviolacea]AOT15305.1 hypothetical protein S40542_21130 [Pseudoalteromonas luteoviolacea]AOT20446.1 hypothetical protein S4054_22380 [Pseudoalteromonas luteoviolacea]KKE83725.1 hypothetical protein N479_12930 [Pseudoalteromonas luteoviolacea S4054]KZN71929.1 hypothetical protein N481_17295 [Pseudoalteromonas luteoviolacea S4047-1]